MPDLPKADNNSPSIPNSNNIPTKAQAAFQKRIDDAEIENSQKHTVLQDKIKHIKTVITSRKKKRMS